jgi:hypothetical protein
VSRISSVFLVVALVLAPSLARAQAKVSTCVVVESSAVDKDALARLVESEVERHPTHHAVQDGCAAHLRVELIDVAGERFLTGRIAGEVPDRVRVEGQDGKALEAAVVALLKVVLGTDPIVLKEPGGHTWLGDRVLALRDHARNRFDFMALEGAHLVSGKPAFLPGLAFGYAREIVDLQIGVEGSVLQSLQAHPGKLGLDTDVRLHAVVTYYLSSEADVAGFVGASIGLEHQRFSGPRAPEAGKGEGSYAATGPTLGLRGGIELFRTTSSRAFLLGEVVLPAIHADDQDGEIVKGWFPGMNLGAGVAF